MPPNRQVKSDVKLFEIVEALQELGGAGVTELARHLDMSKASVHHHLSTMEEHGYAVKENGQYYNGLGFFDVGVDVRNRYAIYHASKTVLPNLAESTGETAWCGVEENGLGMFINGYTVGATMNPDSTLGSWNHLHCSSIGKAILAHLPQERIDTIIQKHGLPEMTPHTITNRDELFEELAEIRERGYAFNRSEDVNGIHAVGVPVIVEEGEVVGALSVAGAANRVSREENRDELVRAVLAAADEVELNLVYG